MTKYVKGAMLAATMLSLGFAGTAFAAPAVSDSDTAVAKVVIKRAVSVSQEEDLDYGTVVTDGTAASVSVNALSGACTESNAAAILCDASTTSARFQVKAFKNTSMDIDVSFDGEVVNPLAADFGTIYLNGAVAGNKLSIAPSVAYSQNGSTSSSATTDTTGKMFVHVGGQLNVGADQANDTYTGTITVTASYL